MRWWLSRLVIVTAVAALRSLPVSAQPADPHTALPERPSVATHAHTVAPGWLEVEAGINESYDNGKFRDTALPFTVKLGLGRRTQLSVAAELAWLAANRATVVGDVSIGLKWRLADHAPIVGAVAVLPSAILPTLSRDSSRETAAGLVLIASREIGPLSLDLNYGYTRHSGDGTNVPRSQSIWAACLGGPMAGPLAWLGELSGSPATSGPAGRPKVVNATVGATLTVSSPVVVDFAVLLPISGRASAAIMTGLVWNVGRIGARRPASP